MTITERNGMEQSKNRFSIRNELLECTETENYKTQSQTQIHLKCLTMKHMLQMNGTQIAFNLIKTRNALGNISNILYENNNNDDNHLAI